MLRVFETVKPNPYRKGLAANQNILGRHAH